MLLGELGVCVHGGLKVHCESRPLEVSSDMTIDFWASGVAGCDTVMTENKPSLLEANEE